MITIETLTCIKELKALNEKSGSGKIM